ncbi:hypothetical protein GCM10022386_07820 [Flavobacterium cheonhonense]|uniref:Uncharacterized protein n=1 Tax=Flavobacterium cheonhonense TaxID=706185 RepID=A0ABP7TJD0_9FLAO|nr:hypothetical protein [Flavobacterium cheonhonense]
MLKINNFYEVKTEGWNWIPVEIIKEENGIFTFRNLLNKEIGKESQKYLREIEIEKIHLDRIGFKKEFFGNIVAKRIAFIIGNDLSKLEIAEFGYIIFDKNNIDSVTEHIGKMVQKVNLVYSENPSSIHTHAIKEEWRTVYNLNDLFDVLTNKFGLSIDKENIITGL